MSACERFSRLGWICLLLVIASASDSLAADCDFMSETLEQIYNKVVNEHDIEDVFLWEVGDSVAILNCGERIFDVVTRADGHYLPLQVRIKSDVDCSDLRKRLPDPIESMGFSFGNEPQAESVFVFVMPVEDWCVLDSLECVTWAGPLRQPTSRVSRDESGYCLFFDEDLTRDSIGLKFVTKKMFSSSGYTIRCERTVSPGGDTVYLSLGAAPPSGGMVYWAFSFAGGHCRIGLEPPEYTLTILGFEAPVNFDVRVTKDSVSIAPTALSDVDIVTNPHRRLPHNLLYVVLLDWPESGWAEYEQEVKSRFARCGAKAFVLEAGNYGRFAVKLDSSDYFTKHDIRMYVGKPVLFFVADTLSEKLGNACEELFAGGKEQAILAHFYSVEGVLPTMLEIVDRWYQKDKDK